MIFFEKRSTKKASFFPLKNKILSYMSHFFKEKKKATIFCIYFNILFSSKAYYPSIR